ncbi:CST complex subunit STN1 [Pristis pectinata]|uniref:CST complex subunit STN1 n=1 Tax=Pristis pectinata TaxID=685728 RepID=UPI00223DE733|nr:CST complex subunit STN1 [Pristis pectinata]XP_051882905.1 CST complex subunit STN1 [Pristis pectinata]
MAHSESVEDAVPPTLWGLDPVHTVFAKLYIRDILELKNSRLIPGVFFYKTHPISKVDILGTVVLKQEKEKFYTFGVDDGTGVISCLCWKKQRPVEVTKPALFPRGLNLLEQLSWIARLEQDNSRVELGDVVRVRGRIRDYREQREINSISVAKVADPIFTAQISRMLELPHLYRSFYDKAFQIPKDGTEANEHGANILFLRSKIKQFLAQNQVKNFYRRELETIDSLSCVAQRCQEALCGRDSGQSSAESSSQGKEEPVGSQCVSRQIHAAFQEAISALQEEGVIFQKVAGPNELYLVTDQEKQLHDVTLSIIREDSTRPKYIEKGCPFLHILSCVQNSYGAGITEATVQRVLDKLECSSEIVSTMDRYYTASCL